jgi:uncharacterized delta-60 repeat protein
MKNRTMVGAGVVAALACGLAFACGDTDEPAPEDAGTTPDAAVDSAGVDGSTVDGASFDGGVVDGNLADGGDGGDAETCPGPAGTLDPSFGDGGMVWLNYRGAQAYGLVTQPDGKIVLVGATQAGFAVFRLLPNGALDPTFGANGLASMLIGVTGNFVSVVLQPDGKIVAAGGAVFSGGRGYDFVVARYLANGTLDPSFGEAGIATAGFGPGPFQDDYGRSVSVLPDGRIVVGGFTETNGTRPTENFAVAMFNADGSLDSTFGTGGKVTIDVRGTPDSPGVIQALAGGKVAIAGGTAETTSVSSQFNASAVRLNADGTKDTSFGDGGISLPSIGSGVHSLVFDVKIDGSGRLLLSGLHNADFGVYRLTPSGQLDPSFGEGGVVATDFGSRSDTVFSILLQPDGKIVAVGTSGTTSNTFGISAARYETSGKLDPTFGVAGQMFIGPGPNSDLSISTAQVDGCTFLTVGVWSYDTTSLLKNAIGVARFRR